MNDKEIWKDIPGYMNYYQVSDLGRVRSKPRIVTNINGVAYSKKERILKPGKDKKGYLYVALYVDRKKSETVKVHILVAIAFLGHKRCGMKLVVDHINYNVTDNRCENLQIITNRENISKDKYRKKPTSKYVGVYKYKHSKKYTARINRNGSYDHLGSFNNEYDAHLAYQKALSKL